MDEETREMEKAIVDSKAEKDRLEAEREREKDMLKKALKLSLDEEPSAPPPEEPAPAPPVSSHHRVTFFSKILNLLILFF